MTKLQDGLWDNLPLLNMLVQVSGLFNSVFIKVQLMLEVGEEDQKMRDRKPKVFFISDLGKGCWSFEIIFKTGNLLFSDKLKPTGEW